MNLPEKDKLLGFSLIELIVVIMIMGLMFGLGYANYRDFQRRQVLEGVVRQFKGDLRLAQQLAATGKKEVECDTLEGYEVSKVETVSPPDDDEYRISALCDFNERCSGTPSYCIKTVFLPPNITIGPFPSPGNRFHFKVLAGGIDRTSDVTIQFRYTVGGSVLETKDVVITSAGEIY